MLVKICNVSDIEDGTLARFDVQNHGILVGRMGSRFFATEASCTHEESDLSLGLFSKEIVTCPLHTAKFEIRSGKVLEGPDGKDPSSIRALGIFETIVKGQELWVNIQ